MPDGRQCLSVLPLTHCPALSTPCADVQEATALVYEAAQASASLALLQQTLQKTVRQRLHKLRRKIAHLTQDSQKLQDSLVCQRYGTLLLTQRLPRGTTQATVIDYYHPEQPMLTIPLDPRLSVRDNAEVYFKRYRKAKAGLAKVTALLAQYREEERALMALETRIAQETTWQTLQALHAELEGQQRMPTPARRETPGLAQALPPYRTFTSSDGYTLYCGKNDRGNEVLLRQAARPEDLWFHAYGRSGAHVILKVQPQQRVPQRTLQQAAALAAFYSKGKHAASVQVMYTQVKHLRKVRGARPGQVTVQTYRLLEVVPAVPGGEPGV